MCPALPGPEHFIFLTLLIISDFCPLPDPDVGVSILVCDIEHTSLHFGVCGSKFVWSVSNTPGGTDNGRGINDSSSTHIKIADIQKALAHNA